MPPPQELVEAATRAAFALRVPKARSRGGQGKATPGENVQSQTQERIESDSVRYVPSREPLLSLPPAPRYASNHSLFLHNLAFLSLFLSSLYYHGLAAVQAKGTILICLSASCKLRGVRTRNAIAVYQSFLCLLKALLL